MKNFSKINRALVAEKNFNKITRALAAEKHFKLFYLLIALVASLLTCISQRAYAYDDHYTIDFKINRSSVNDDGIPLTETGLLDALENDEGYVSQFSSISYTYCHAGRTISDQRVGGIKLGEDANHGGSFTIDLSADGQVYVESINVAASVYNAHTTLKLTVSASDASGNVTIDQTEKLVSDVNLVPSFDANTYSATHKTSQITISSNKYCFIESVFIYYNYPSGTCGDNLTWTFVESTGTLTITGTGAMTDYATYTSKPWHAWRKNITSVVLPDGLTSIGNCAFYGCSALTSIDIPAGVTGIGNSAFNGCTALTSVTIPTSVTSIGVAAFASCKALTSIEIPSGVTAIADNTFNSCLALNSIDIPSSVTSIGVAAFMNCQNLESITIPENVTEIGTMAFNDCSNLADIYVGWTSTLPTLGNDAFTDIASGATFHVPAGTSANYTSAPWNSFTIVEVNPSGQCGANLFWEYNPSTTTLTISGTGAMNDYTSTPMPWNAYKTEITSVVLPSGLTSIGRSSFMNCYHITSIEIPSSVTMIERTAFMNCTALAEVTFLGNVSEIKSQAFLSCHKPLHITFLGDTPPLLPSGSNTGKSLGNVDHVNITVPCGLVPTYITAWTSAPDDYSARIHSACEVGTMDDVYAAAVATGYSSYSDVDLRLDGWQVSGAWESSSLSSAFITDGEKGFLISVSEWNSLPFTFTEGNTISGLISKYKLQLANNSYVYVSPPSLGDGIFDVTETAGTISFQNKTIGELSGINTGAPVILSNLTCTKRDEYDAILTDGTNTIHINDKLFSGAINAVEVGKHYNITGIFTQSNSSTKNIAPRSIADIKLITENYDITANPDPNDLNTYYSTFYHSSKAYVLPSGVEAYTAQLSGSDLILTKIAQAGDVLPYGTAVILKSSVEQFEMTPSDASPVTVGGNDLQGVDAATAAPSNCYVLSGKASDNSVTGVGFYQFSGTLGAHKAYMVVSGGAGAPKRLRFVFDTATGVESLVRPASDVSSQKVLRDGQLIIIRNGAEYNANGQKIK